MHASSPWIQTQRLSFVIPDSLSDVLREPDIRTYVLSDDGTFPNNGRLPVLAYSNAVRTTGQSPARTLETVFRTHQWTGTWKNGIFSYHHYHSTTHEVLGIARGAATVQLGGPEGMILDVTAGDVLVLPAGVAHKNREADRDFLVVGAYPQGRRWDLKEGESGERPEADRNIEEVPRPTRDPVYGKDGPLQEHWQDSTTL